MRGPTLRRSLCRAGDKIILLDIDAVAFSKLQYHSTLRIHLPSPSLSLQGLSMGLRQECSRVTGHPEDASKEQKWGTWAGVWRTLAIRLDGASIIGIRDNLSSPFACSNQIPMRRIERYSALRRRVTLRYSGEVTAEVGITTAFHPPLLHGFITSC